MILNVKITGIEGDSVLVKFSSENSAKNIDEYDAVAYQPKALGYGSIEAFVQGIQPALLDQAIHRDNLEKVAEAELDLSQWVGHESEHAFATLSDHNASLITNEAVANPEVAIEQTTPENPAEVTI